MADLIYRPEEQRAVLTAVRQDTWTEFSRALSNYTSATENFKRSYVRLSWWSFGLGLLIGILIGLGVA